jgi:hypothetical protein
MGEFSTINAIKSVMVGTPSFCVNGLKLKEHLSEQLKKLNIKTGKDAEVDIINISCNDNKINIVFGECKVTKKIQFYAFGLIRLPLLLK